ncbi:MAG: transposase [Candidatus Aminicenantes bacterium]|nr:transposase [Candidatus Aminicenantes bacterium]
MMSNKHGRRYTAKFKFQLILELLKGSKTTGQIARAFGVHPITISHWNKEFMEKGPELFSQSTTIHEYERKIQELERLIGHKEVEIALLKNFLAGSSPGRRK